MFHGVGSVGRGFYLGTETDQGLGIVGADGEAEWSPVRVEIERSAEGDIARNASEARRLDDAARTMRASLWYPVYDSGVPASRSDRRCSIRRVRKLVRDPIGLPMPAAL